MNERLSTQDLVDLLAEKHGMSKKDADGFVKEFFLLIEQALESDRCVKIKGLGTFKLVDVDSRESVKVNTGERFQIQGHTKVSFTPDPSLRDVVNRPFAHFETVVLNDNTVLEDTPVEEEQEDESEEVVEPVEKLSSEKSAKDEELAISSEPDEVEVVEIKDVPESLIEVTQVEESKPLFSAESIIAAELRQAAQVFGTVQMAPTQDEQLLSSLPQKPILNKPKKEKSATPYLVAIILFVLLLCSSALVFVYYPDLFDPKEITQTPPPQPVVQQKGLLDTLIAAKDTVAEVVPKVSEVPPVAPPKEASKPAPAEVNTPSKAGTPVKPDSVNYKISGTKATYTVKEGETLTRISLLFYGTKDFWPYIVQHNRDVIKNPDNVPYGTKIKIPELVKK